VAESNLSKRGSKHRKSTRFSRAGISARAGRGYSIYALARCSNTKILMPLPACKVLLKGSIMSDEINEGLE